MVVWSTSLRFFKRPALQRKPTFIVSLLSAAIPPAVFFSSPPAASACSHCGALCVTALKMCTCCYLFPRGDVAEKAQSGIKFRLFTRGAVQPDLGGGLSRDVSVNAQVSAAIH